MTSNAARAATLERALRAGVDGDRDALGALCTTDVRAWTPGLSTTSLSELLDELARRDEWFSGIELDVTPLDVGGDHACVEWIADVTPRGMLALADLSPEERAAFRLTLHGVTVAEFHGERICALRQYWDELAVLDQLGVLASALLSEPGPAS